MITIMYNYMYDTASFFVENFLLEILFLQTI